MLTIIITRLYNTANDVEQQHELCAPSSKLTQRSINEPQSRPNTFHSNDMLSKTNESSWQHRIAYSDVVSMNTIFTRKPMLRILTRITSLYYMSQKHSNNRQSVHIEASTLNRLCVPTLVHTEHHPTLVLVALPAGSVVLLVVLSSSHWHASCTCCVSWNRRDNITRMIYKQNGGHAVLNCAFGYTIYEAARTGKQSRFVVWVYFTCSSFPFQFVFSVSSLWCEWFSCIVRLLNTCMNAFQRMWIKADSTEKWRRKIKAIVTHQKYTHFPNGLSEDWL